MPNPYPARFLDLLAETDGLALDCGSGGRQMDGVIGLEAYDMPWCDIVGDGMALPFRDEAFSLVLSQAVIEHVERPERYVDEAWRVLKPGGLLYAEVAFMQPVHMPPQHFFNVTPHGLRWLCRHFEILEEGTCGGVRQVIEWMLKEAGITGVKVPRFREPGAGRMPNVACGVTILARRPL